MKEIEIDGKYRLHRVDQMNWEVQEFREPEAKGKARDSDRSPRWIGTGNYFQSVPAALVWLLHREQRNGGDGTETIDQSIERMGALVDRLVAQVREACNG